MKPFTRRSVLGLSARGASLFAMTLAGLVPGAPPSDERAENIARGRQFVLTRARSAAKEARVAAATRDADGQVASAFLRSEGFASAPIEADVADLAWSDGEHIGRLDQLVFYDATRDRYARLVRQQARGRSVTGVSIWGAARPEHRVVYDLTAGALTRSAALTRLADGSVEIVRANGKRLVVPPKPDTIASAKGPGLAAVNAATICTAVCGWQCTFVCELVCTTVLIETCVISAACGPLAPICLGFCIVSVIATCAYNCGNYCQWACTTTCTWVEG